MSAVTLEEAVVAISAAVPPRQVERIPLADALWRTLAEDVASLADHPSADQSAMDGYACRAADTRGADAVRPVRLRVIGEAAAGRPFSGRLGPGEAVAIATGASLPRGSDAVVVLELARTEGADVLVHAPAVPKHIRRRAEDLRRSSTYLFAGELLDPVRVGAAAALGRAALSVVRRPRVGILVTGPEVVPPGASLRPGQVFDANAALLASLLSSLGAEPVVLEAIGDGEEALARALAAGAGWDLLVTTGGASVGRHDAVRKLLEREAEVCFGGIRVRPGGPAMLGRWGSSPVLALPGNPVAAMILGTVLLGAWCHAALGRRGALPFPAREVAVADAPVRGVPEKTALWLARTRSDGDGRRRVTVGEHQGAARIQALLGANALVVVPPGSGLAAGDPAEIVPIVEGAFSAGAGTR